MEVMMSILLITLILRPIISRGCLKMPPSPPGVIRLAASLSLTQLLVVARRRTLYLLSGLATILSLAAFATVLLLADITSHREQPVMFREAPFCGPILRKYSKNFDFFKGKNNFDESCSS